MSNYGNPHQLTTGVAGAESATPRRLPANWGFADPAPGTRKTTTSFGSVPPAGRYFTLLWLGCTVLLLLGVIAAMGRGPWDPDELKYAQVVHEMSSRGDLLVPHLWGSVYADKPPLYFWLVLLSSRFLPEIGLPALLVPVLASACLGLWLIGHIASRWYGRQTGMLAVGVLVSLPLYLLAAQVGRMDMLLALLVTAAVYWLYRGYVEDLGWAQVLAFALMGLGVLAKGPFAFLFPLGIAVAFLAVTRELRKLCTATTGLGLLVLLGVVAIWLVPAVTSAGIDYLKELVGEHTLNFAVSGGDHPEPAYFYLMILPALLMPWMIFIVPAVRAAWHGWRTGRDRRELWLLCWIAVPIVILSLVRAKLPVYVLPIMPPVAILVGRYWHRLFTEPGEYTRARWRVVSLFALSGAAGVGFVAAGLLPGWDAVQSHLIIAGGALLVLIGLAGWLVDRHQCQSRTRGVFAALAAAAPCGALFLALVVLPPMDATRSWRTVADSMAAARDPGAPVVAFQLRPYLGYYFKRDIVYLQEPEDLDGLVKLVHQSGSVWCAVRDEHLDVLRRWCLVDC